MALQRHRPEQGAAKKQQVPSPSPSLTASPRPLSSEPNWSQEIKEDGLWFTELQAHEAGKRRVGLRLRHEAAEAAEAWVKVIL